MYFIFYSSIYTMVNKIVGSGNRPVEGSGELKQIRDLKNAPTGKNPLLSAVKVIKEDPILPWVDYVQEEGNTYLSELAVISNGDTESSFQEKRTWLKENFPVVPADLSLPNADPRVIKKDAEKILVYEDSKVVEEQGSERAHCG